MSSIKNKNSIHKRLMMYLMGFSLLLFITVAVSNILAILDEVEENFDGEISLIAHFLHSINPKENINPAEQQVGVSDPIFLGGENYEKYYFFQISSKNGTLLFRSQNAPLETVQPIHLNQFQNKTIDSQDYRIYQYLSEQSNQIISVGQSPKVRHEIPQKAVTAMAIYFVIFFPIIFFTLRWIIKKGLLPLTKISSDIQKRSPSNLDAIDIKSTPLELTNIISSMNHLFSRLQSALENERRFTADAAHELRTPLAGLKAQSQIALKDKSRVEHSLKRIVEGVDRSTRLAEQLLSLSKIDQLSIQAERLLSLSKIDQLSIQSEDKFSLNDLIATLLEDLETEITRHNITTKLTTSGTYLLNMEQSLCYIMMKNLIENAIRYSPPSTQIVIALTEQSQALSLTISDQGGGIENEALSRVFDRFYRSQHHEVAGSGLGLSIVKRISEITGINITLENITQPPGLKATLIFNAYETSV